MSMKVTEGTPASAVDWLALPALGTLTDQQVRGQACVWDAAPLAGAPAVDLGEQATSRAGQPVRWFPRACRPCLGLRAYQAILDHGSTCEQCVDDGSRCDTGLSLSRLVREARR